jgi:C-terminal processing protease CtpA/Prc
MCAGGGDGNDPKAKGNAVVKLRIIDKKKSDGGGQCPKTFGGIGIEFDFSQDGAVVTRVFHGYPAEKAGIVVGDVLLDNPNGVRGEPGSTIVVRVMRKGESMSIPIRRDKICVTADSD